MRRSRHLFLVFPFRQADMSDRRRQRVHRGHPGAEPGQSGTGPAEGIKGGPIVAGDHGAYPGPLSEASPTEVASPDLDAREFGVPQADIPGGKRHWVNPQQHPAKTVHKGERPADYHKYHGVAPTEPGQVVTPSTEDKDIRHPRPAPEPKYSDAVPVYMVQRPDKGPRKRVVGVDVITVPVSTAEPIRVCTDDPNRVTIFILNEDQATDIRFGDRSSCIEGRAAMLTHFSNSYFEVKNSEQELFAVTTSTTLTAKMSIVTITEIDER